MAHTPGVLRVLPKREAAGRSPVGRQRCLHEHRVGVQPVGIQGRGGSSDRLDLYWIWEEHLGSSYGKGPPPKQTFIKTLTGQTIVIPYDAEDTILRMQEKLCDVTGVPPAQQRLVWRGRVLAKAAPVSTTNARSAK